MVGGKLNNKIISNRCQIFSQLLKASSQIYDYKCKSHTCNQCARCVLTLESSIMAYPLLKFGRGAKSKFLKGMWSLKHSGPICLDMQAAIASLSFFEGQCLKGRASVGRVFGMVLKPYPNPPPPHTHTLHLQHFCYYKVVVYISKRERGIFLSASGTSKSWTLLIPIFLSCCNDTAK